MKAIRIHRYGGLDVLAYEEAPEPRVGADDVLVRVDAAGVNPIDWRVRRGERADRLRHRFPLIVGWDVCGTVVGCGANVTRFELGDAVYGCVDMLRDGAYAERLAARATELARTPTRSDPVVAAAVPLAGLTAWQALFEAPSGYRGAGLRAGQSVLIHAAAGGVGSFAVQLAKWKGARVVGTCSANHVEYVRSIGADDVIDYTSTRFEDAARDLDVVVDLVGGDTLARSWNVLRKDGILVSVVSPPSENEAVKRGVRAGYVFVQPSALQLDELATLIDAGTIRVDVSHVLPLALASEAHARSEARHVRGKIVLKVRD